MTNNPSLDRSGERLQKNRGARRHWTPVDHLVASSNVHGWDKPQLGGYGSGWLATASANSGGEPRHTAITAFRALRPRNSTRRVCFWRPICIPYTEN